MPRTSGCGRARPSPSSPPSPETWCACATRSSNSTPRPSDPGKGDAALIEPQLLGILGRLGVEPYAPVEGDSFDATLHTGVGRTKTTDPDLDGRVAAVRREGFTTPDGRPLRAAEVEVWHHVPSEPGGS